MRLLKKSLQKVANLFGYRVIKTEYFDKITIDPIMESEFSHIYEKCKGYTMTSKERMYGLYKAIRYIVNARIPGDFVECGVWRGGSAMIIAYTLLELGVTDRRVYLYDTFEGMTKPTQQDYRISDRAPALEKWEQQQKKDCNNWCFVPLEEVKRNLGQTSYPKEMLIFVKGKVEETIPKTIPKKIALLRLDTDWYESTKHELNYLFPIITKGGVLIIDDYGHYAGSKKAVDEYIDEKGIQILLNRVDYTARLGIKIQ